MKEIDYIYMKIEKLKASMERHKAWQNYYQTIILSGLDKSQIAYTSLKSHTNLIDECVEKILKIEYIQ